MLSCDEAAAAIVRLSDGDAGVDPGVRMRLETHLRTCAACRDALDTQRAVSAWLQSRPSDRVSDAFAARLGARLDDESGWFGLADWRAWTLRLTPVAALLAAFVLLGSAPADTTVTLDEWVSNADASAPESLLLEPDVNADAIVESIVIGDGPAAGGANDAGK
jgi:hypothetical protein